MKGAAMKLSTTTNRLSVVVLFIALATLAGCASVPMASKEQDAIGKTFASPAPDKAGLYIFRNSFVGKALTKAVSIDGTLIGVTANKTYFYKIIAPGNHTLSTESEFGENILAFQAETGKNYFARQYIKMGVFRGGANLEMVSEEDGKREVLECEQAQ
jgi:hypothetical protein